MSSVVMKHSGLKLLITLAIVAATFAVGIAEAGDEGEGEKKVLTTFEEVMQKKISVDFRNTPIDDVIRIMAEQADVDIIKSPKVIGNVTTTLTDVPLEEALINILAAHGYGVVIGKNMIRIAPAEELTEVAERLVSRIYRITYADVTEVEVALKKFISQRGALSSNPGTSNIIVTDSESKIKAIDKFIEEIDRITPQILVEARIYDITSKDRLDLGIEWEVGRNTGFFTETAAGGTQPALSGTGTLGADPGNRNDPFTKAVFGGATGKTSGTTGVIRFGWLTPHFDIDAVLRAQQNIINAKLLANPRVLVLDNQQAMIKIISEHPYQELTESATGGTMGTTNFKEVGVELQVTPHITRDEMVRLELKPRFSVKTGTVTFTTGSLQYPQPIIDTREADTTLLVKSGQTVVLGGLRKKEVNTLTNKIPLLGDLPLVGLLFKFEGEDTVTSELVVFITPWIIEQPVLSPTEIKQFEVTDFAGPEPIVTKAEKKVSEEK